MLPQMMPLPWIIIFAFLFFCFYSVVLYFSSFYCCSASSDNKVKISSIVLSW